MCDRIWHSLRMLNKSEAVGRKTKDHIDHVIPIDLERSLYTHSSAEKNVTPYTGLEVKRRLRANTWYAPLERGLRKEGKLGQAVHNNHSLLSVVI